MCVASCLPAKDIQPGIVKMPVALQAAASMSDSGRLGTDIKHKLLTTVIFWIPHSFVILMHAAGSKVFIRRSGEKKAQNIL